MAKYRVVSIESNKIGGDYGFRVERKEGFGWKQVTYVWAPDGEKAKAKAMAWLDANQSVEFEHG